MALKSRLTVEVTQADIDKATQNDSVRCVVAQAIARTFPEANHIGIDVASIRFTHGAERLIFMTPYSVQGYIVAFDAGEDIHPFKFQLRDPKRLTRRIRTEAGKAMDQARRKKPVARTTKRATETDAAADVESVKAAYADQPQSKTQPGERPPKRVFTPKRRRAYGHRLLRINQTED